MAKVPKVKIHIELGVETYRIGDGQETTDRVDYGEVIGMDTDAGYVLCKVNDPESGDFKAYVLAGDNLDSGLIVLGGTTREYVDFGDEEGGPVDAPDVDGDGSDPDGGVDGDDTEDTDPDATDGDGSRDGDNNEETEHTK